MEETKFYTPEIEEFHVGFEYEWNRKDSNESFQKGVIIDGKQIDDIYNTVYDIRVKCLDMEDIVSLGWSPYLINVNGFFFKLGSNSDIELSFMRQNGLTIRNYSYELFFGTIRNKSELKLLMKQLGIIV